MEELEMIILRKECMAFAVDSGAHFSEAINIAAQYCNYIMEGEMPGAQVLPFPSAVPGTPKG